MTHSSRGFYGKNIIRVKKDIGEFVCIREKVKDKIINTYLSIPYAKAARFGYPVLITDYRGIANSTTTYCFPQKKVPPFVNTLFKCPLMRNEFLPKKDKQVENAFYLNIWTEHNENNLKPVLVYIHGGGFSDGSGTCPVYNGTNLACKGIVVVTINYRLGIWGFASIKKDNEVISNLGFYDQQCALKWVKENISFFGGDPNNITLMGQSAGAISALIHYLNKESAELINRVVICSGTMIDVQTEEQALRSMEKTLKKNKIKDINELKTLPFNKRIKTDTDILFPVIDHGIIKDTLLNRQRHGDFIPLPVLIGTNEDELSITEVPLWYKKLGIVKNEVKLLGKYTELFNEDAPEIIDAFKNEARDTVDLQFRIMELAVFHGQAYMLMKLLSRKTEVFGYRFNCAPDLYKGLRGAYHGAEIAMFFDNMDKMNINIRESDLNAIERLQTDWLAFIKDGVIVNREIFNKNNRITCYDNEKATTVDFPHKKLIEGLCNKDVFSRVIDRYLKNRGK